MTHATTAHLISEILGDSAILQSDLASEAGRELAVALKLHFDTYKYTDALRARPAVDALEALAQIRDDDPQIAGLALWAKGTFLIIEGQPAEALPLIRSANELLASGGNRSLAAGTLVTLVSALGMLGRYDDAIQVALEAHVGFTAAGEIGRAAEIDLNLGHLYYFVSDIEQSLMHYMRAEQRFTELQDVRLLAGARSGRADLLIEQGRFAEAIALQEATLALAEQHGDLAQLTLSHESLGYLYAHQGLYHRAIEHYQRGIALAAERGAEPEQRANELYLAEAYLNLNLLDEVIFRCEPLVTYFETHERAFQHATALALLGIAQARAGNAALAQQALEEGEAIFAAIGSKAREADLQLARADLALALNEHDQALTLAQNAEQIFRDSGVAGRAAHAGWLCGEALRVAGQHIAADAAIRDAAGDAERLVMPALQQRCATSLGLLALASSDRQSARTQFLHAVDLIERGRAPLPGEELRAAYFGDKLIPYQQLVHLAIADGAVADAFFWIERARGRAMLDMIHPDRPLEGAAPQVASAVSARYEELRRSLHVCYNRLNHPNDDDDRSAEAQAKLEQDVVAYERELAALARQIHADSGGHSLPLALADVQAALRPNSQLLEYWVDGNTISALVIGRDTVHLLPEIATEHQVAFTLRQLRLQISRLSYGQEFLARHQNRSLATIQSHLQSLYQLLITPLRHLINTQRLIIVPHGLLHYIPFAALHDGNRYMVERHTLAYSPAASLLPNLQVAPEAVFRQPLLVGVPDEHVPQIEPEIRRLAELFPDAGVLLGVEADEMTIRHHLASADSLHMACHGVFRPASPLSSALRLHNGWLTVRDIYDFDLRNCPFVALSACETGVSYIAPGDELLGLARGFLSAGARALLLSQWLADDSAVALLMERFYNFLTNGVDYAEALRLAQLEVLGTYPNPAHWAPWYMLSA